MTAHWKTLTFLALGFILGTISIGVVYAWTGPTQSPPNGNVAAPVNVGTIDQVKAGGFGAGSLRVTGSDGYLNFGDATGESGYGLRDNAGTLEFRNSGGAWDSIQSIVYNLIGGSGSWTASGDDIYNSNSGNVGIGTASPSEKLQVGGNVRASDYYISDIGLWTSQLRLSQQLGPEYYSSSNSCGNGVVTRVSTRTRQYGSKSYTTGSGYSLRTIRVPGRTSTRTYVYCRAIYY